MAPTYATIAKLSLGNTLEKVVDITADAAYTAGGYTLGTTDFSALGVPGTVLGDLISFDSETNLGGVSTVLDRTNNKLMFWERGAQSTTTVTSTKVRVRVTYRPVNFK